MADSVYLDKFREFSDKLEKAITPSLKNVAGKLSAKGHIAQLTKMEATSSPDPQKTATKIIDELQDTLKEHKDPATFLNEVCTALRNVREKRITDAVENLETAIFEVIGDKEEQTKDPAKEKKPAKTGAAQANSGEEEIDSEPPDWQYDDHETVNCVIESLDFNKDLVEDVKILLMPATSSEEDPVLYYLKQSSERCIETYISGLKIYIGNYGKNKVIVLTTAKVKNRQGPIHAGVVTAKILEKIPSIKYIVAVGVCFGIGKKYKLGDVIISSIICDFTNKREGVGENEYYRGPQHEVKATILNKFTLFSHESEMPHNIAVDSGPIISTCNLIDNPQVKEEMVEHRKDAIAGEMEGAGIMTAINYLPEPTVEAIVIKGIGDWGDGNKKATEKWKPFAARAAAHYVHAALNKQKFQFEK